MTNELEGCAAPAAAQLDAELPPSEVSKQEVDYFVYKCRQAGADTTYDIVNAVVAPYAERIRLLAEELAGFHQAVADAKQAVEAYRAQQPAQTIDTLDFVRVFGAVLTADRQRVKRGAVADPEWLAAYGALIAYIDARTAGTAPDAVPASAEAPRSREWQPVTRTGQVECGDKLRFKIGDQAYNETARLILDKGTDKEEVVYNKSRNFYFITSMVISGRSSHKCVEVLATAPSLSGTEEAKP